MNTKVAFALLAALSAFAASPDSVLARMDQAASTFRGMTANITKTSYTAVIQESTEESGIIRMRSPKPRQVGALIEFDKPAPKSIAFRDKKAQIYLPKINTVQEYDLGKYNDLLTQGLLIGFATPSKDLKKNYAIKVAAEESVAGQKATKLELIPTQDTIKQHLNRIELWIGDADGLPVQQKLYQPSGDYTQIQYRDMKLDPSLTEQQVKLNLPANVKREFPQK